MNFEDLKETEPNLPQPEKTRLLKRAVEIFEAKKKGDVREFARLAIQARVEKKNVAFSKY